MPRTTESTYQHSRSVPPDPVVERADHCAPKNGGAQPALFASRWQWRELVASKHGPPAYTTRLVLLVLSLQMQGDLQPERRGGAPTKQLGISFPSQMTIADRTGLRLRTVKLAIAVARRSGWLSVAATVATNNGRGWRGNEYTATVPAYLAEHIPDFDMQFNRPANRGAYGAPPSPQPQNEVVHMTVIGGADNRIEVVHDMPPESLRESLRESSLSAPPKNGGARDAPRQQGARNSDELKTRVSEKTSAEAVREMARTAMARPVLGPRAGKPKPITDSDLAEKVRKLRAAGVAEETIQRQFAAQVSQPQLQRVLRKGGANGHG